MHPPAAKERLPNNRGTFPLASKSKKQSTKDTDCKSLYYLHPISLKAKGFHILDYFFGHSEKKNGRWEKVTTGVLEERKSRQPVPA